MFVKERDYLYQNVIEFVRYSIVEYYLLNGVLDSYPKLLKGLLNLENNGYSVFSKWRSDSINL